MNKEQIQKHRDIIKWFCDNAELGVWCKNGNSDKSNKDWFLNIEPKFLLDSIYVQNDEYAELRKAQADDKVIEYKTSNGEIVPLKLCMIKFREFKGCLENYRIKTDEPSFKIGDWVREKDSTKIKLVTKIGCAGDNAFELDNQGNGQGFLIENASRDFELWEPQEGEWCVFWERDAKHYIVDKLDKIETYPSDGVSTKCTKYWAIYCDAWFHSIAPLKFIHTLKDR